MANNTLNKLDDRLKDVIQTLYNIQFVLHGYEGPTTQAELVRYVSLLGPQLQATTKFNPADLPLLPPEVINEYIEQGRNPDVYTREFVERVQRDNAYHKGKVEALEGFRDALADEMLKNFGKEIEPFIERVLNKGHEAGDKKTEGNLDKSSGNPMMGSQIANGL